MGDGLHDGGTGQVSPSFTVVRQKFRQRVGHCMSGATQCRYCRWVLEGDCSATRGASNERGRSDRLPSTREVNCLLPQVSSLLATV